VKLRGDGGHESAASREPGRKHRKMKKLILVKLSFCCLAFQMGGQEKALAADGALKTDAQKAGYAFGVNIGTSLKKNNIAADADWLGKAAQAQLTGAPSLMTSAQATLVLKALPTGPTNLPAGEKNFKTVQQEIGYAIGWSFGQQMKIMEVDLDVTNLIKGVQDTVAGRAPLLTSNEVAAVFTVIHAKVQEKQMAKMQEREALFKAEGAKDNLKEGTDFMAKNKKAPGVIALTNGLQYTIMTKGAGPIPKPADSVEVNYRGMFLDGKEFDASPPGQPFSCRLTGGEGGVIDGWINILKLMPVGSKWKVFIPPDQAYHAQGKPPVIPPNATLVFEMELVSIDPVN
jgi:FKBP-type peptidyl-prolyl cis-trans isomerase